MIAFESRQTCPLCGGGEAKILHKQAYDSADMQAYLGKYYSGRVPLAILAGGEYILYQCQTCRGMYQGQILNPEGLRALYETWIGAEGSLQKRHQSSLGDKIGYARQAMQIIKACGHPPHEIHVLDFGMGWGTWLLMARAWGMEAAGMELSAERQAYAQSQGLEVISDIPPASFHFINAEQVFEHLDNPHQVLLDCAAGLKAGGFLRVAVPDGRATQKKLGAGTWALGDMPSIPLEHINIFTPASLQKFAARAGLRPIQPPLVLPAFSFHPAELRQVLGVAGQHLALTWGLVSNTVQWFGKVNA